MIQCRQCRSIVSDEYQTCPNCGANMRMQNEMNTQYGSNGNTTTNATQQGQWNMGYNTQPQGNMNMNYNNPPQGNRNMGYSTQPQGNMNMGYNNPPQGNRNMGYSAQPQSNSNMGYNGTPQMDPNMAYDSRRQMGGYQANDQMYEKNWNGYADPMDAQNNKAMGILAYIGILVLVPLFAGKESRFARFHASQGLNLFLCEIIASILYMISFSFGLFSTPGNLLRALCMILYLAIDVFAIWGIVIAAKGEQKELPLIGRIHIIH